MTAPVVDAQPLVTAIGSAVTAAGVAFGDGKKPTVATGHPYVVAFFDTGTVDDRTLVGRDGWSIYCSFQCAGLSPESARFAVRKVRAAVLGLHGTTVDERLVLMPVHATALPMDREDDADPTLFIQIDEWRIRTVPT